MRRARLRRSDARPNALSRRRSAIADPEPDFRSSAPERGSAGGRDAAPRAGPLVGSDAGHPRCRARAPLTCETRAVPASLDAAASRLQAPGLEEERAVRLGLRRRPRRRRPPCIMARASAASRAILVTERPVAGGAEASHGAPRPRARAWRGGREDTPALRSGAGRRLAPRQPPDRRCSRTAANSRIAAPTGTPARPDRRPDRIADSTKTPATAGTPARATRGGRGRGSSDA